MVSLSGDLKSLRIVTSRTPITKPEGDEDCSS